MAEAVQVTIPIDELRRLAQRLLDAYDQLKSAQPLALRGGNDYLDQTQPLTTDVRAAIDKFNANRVALLSQLIGQSMALREMANNFDELEEGTRQALKGMEDTSDLILNNYPIPTSGSTGVPASTSSYGGAATGPAASASSGTTTGTASAGGSSSGGGRG